MRHALLGLTLLSMTACLDPDAPLDASDTDPIVFEVAPGSTANGLTDPLLDQGLLPSTWQWKLYLRQADAGCLKAGKFTLRRSMSMSQVLSTLCGPPMVEDEPFTVVEGWRIRDIDEALARKGWIQPGAYRALAESKDLGLPFPVEGPTLEGYLFPETYRVVPDRFTAKDFLERQLTTFQERFLAQHPDGFGDRSLHEVVIMASMLEREEPKPTQRPIVAGILWKRLDHG